MLVLLVQLKPWLHAPVFLSEVLPELLERGSGTRRATLRTTHPSCSDEVLMGVFWLRGRKTRLRKSVRMDVHFVRFPPTRFLNLADLSDLGQHLRRKKSVRV